MKQKLSRQVQVMNSVLSFTDRVLELTAKNALYYKKKKNESHGTNYSLVVGAITEVGQ